MHFFTAVYFLYFFYFSSVIYYYVKMFLQWRFEPFAILYA